MTRSEQNKAAARSLLDALEHGNLAVLDAIVSPEYVLHDPTLPEAVRGVEGAKEMVEAYRDAFGARATVEHQVGEGDYVATRYTVHGKHDAEFMGIAPTGRDVTVTGICISRFRGGKIVEEWEAWDALGVLEQIGASRTPAHDH